MNLSWFGVQGGIVYTSSSNSIFLVSTCLSLLFLFNILIFILF